MQHDNGTFNAQYGLLESGAFLIELP